MDRSILCVVLFCLFSSTLGVQTFYMAENGGTNSCSSQLPCGSLGDIIPLIGTFEPYEVVINVFPGFYNESATSVVFPELSLVTILKYDPNGTGDDATFFGPHSAITTSSSVTISNVIFQEYSTLFSIASPTIETNIQLANSSFINVDVLFSNIKDAVVVLTNISMSTTDDQSGNDYLRSRSRGLFTDKEEYPKSFSIIGGTFTNLKYGQYIIQISSDQIEIVDAVFTASGRMNLRSYSSSIITGTSFISPDGMNREGGYGGCKCTLLLAGTWFMEDSFMGGYTYFTGFIAKVNDDLNLTMTNNSPGYFDISAFSFFADNCEFHGIIRANQFLISNSIMGSNWETRPVLYGAGKIFNSTVNQYDILASCDFDEVIVYDSTLQLAPYTAYGGYPSKFTNITNSKFQNINGVEIRDLSVNIMNSKFSGCYSSDSGGALSITNGGNVAIIDSNFTSNTADSVGGAVFLKSDNNIVLNVNIEGSLFADNKANLGAAIACFGKVSILNIDDATFEGNVAEFAGYQEDQNMYCASLTQVAPAADDENSSNAWLWIILGLLAAFFVVFAISIAVIAIVMYVRNRRAKEEFDIETTENNPY